MLTTEIKTRPILFSSPMVKAILAGRKTQTRRIIKPQPVAGVRHSPFSPTGLEDGHGRAIKMRYGLPGDRLIVKEDAWMYCERRPNGFTAKGRQKWLYVPLREAGVFYCADKPDKPVIGVVHPDTGNHWGWRKKLGRFLPSWASRITLEIDEVRVERVQMISEEDAAAEGFVAGYGPQFETHGMPGLYTARERFKFLWHSLNGIESWGLNDWVYVIKFVRVK